MNIGLPLSVATLRYSGMHPTTCLASILEINYSSILQQICKDVLSWRKFCLWVGKINILKMYFLEFNFYQMLPIQFPSIQFLPVNITINIKDGQWLGYA